MKHYLPTALPPVLFAELPTALFTAVLTTLLTLLACGSAPHGVRSISQDELLTDPPAGALLLDVRTPKEFASGHVPGAVNIPYDELGARVAELGADESSPVVVYCESGKRAGKAATVLEGAGFENILHLDGDMSAWRANGRPTAKP